MFGYTRNAHTASVVDEKGAAWRPNGGSGILLLGLNPSYHGGYDVQVVDGPHFLRKDVTPPFVHDSGNHVRSFRGHPYGN